MKILPPTLREKKRYLVFELVSEKNVQREDLIREIFSCANLLIGDVGSSECNLRLLKYENSKGIIRCNYLMTDTVRAVLATVNSIAGAPVLIYVMGISGTVAKATEKYLENENIFKPNNH